MLSRGVTILTMVLAGVLFVSAIAWPTAALTLHLITEQRAPAAGWGLSLRQLGLLWRTLLLAGGGAGLTMLLAVPATLAMTRAATTARSALTWLLLAPLFCPPMVYALGWERLQSWSGISLGPAAGTLRCLLVWSMWAWPIPTLLLAGGWARAGRSAYQSALLDTTPTRAGLRVVLPILSRHIFSSLMILLILFFGDFGVPHICGLRVFATELLGWSDSSPYAIDTVWPSLLAMFIALLIAGVVYRMLGGEIISLLTANRSTDLQDTTEDHDTTASPESATPWHSPTELLWLLIPFALVLVSIGLPIGALVKSSLRPGVLAQATKLYGIDVVRNMLLAWLAGGLSILLGLVAASWQRVARVSLAWVIIVGMLPGAVVGQAMIAAYLHLPAIYDSAAVLLFAYLARFGWIGMLVGVLATRSTARGVTDAAQTDGASRLRLWWTIHGRLHLASLLAGAGIVAVLAVGEIAAPSLVSVPGIRLIAPLMIEKYHRFEDGMLVSLAVANLLAGMPLLVAAAITSRD